MYTPKAFVFQDHDALQALIRAAPLATLIVEGEDGWVANHLPFVLQDDAEGGLSLRAHVPRANPLSETLREARSGLAIFHGPQGYISPSWYATKQEHGRVVPTWNYAAVHAHGRLRAIDDPAWVRAQLECLTEQSERGYAQPWSLADAPGEFIERMIEALVGIELRVEHLEGKNKASQNQPRENQRSVLAALAGDPDQRALHEWMRKALSSDD